MAALVEPDPQGAGLSSLARDIVRLRLSMMLINDLIKQKSFSVPIHLALGHEAIAVAVAATMEEQDRLLLTHRNIHYNMARTCDLKSEVEEYRLGEQGLGGGRLGAMNLTNADCGVVYTSSILANCLPVAAGVAKARAIGGARSVTIAVTGDGAIEEGAFHEALMMARSLQLPILFLVENNEWSMYTRIDERRCAFDLHSLAAAFGVPYCRLSGNEPTGYSERLAALRADAIERAQPAIVEVTINTLGGWWLEEDGREPRFINYHHGAVPHLCYADDPVIEQSEQDPVFVLSRHFADSDWRHLIAEVRDSLDLELA